MPRGDGTGPAGFGSKMGRGAGYCQGNDTPGFESTGDGRGMGRGLGRGRGQRNGGTRSGGFSRPRGTESRDGEPKRGEKE